MKMNNPRIVGDPNQYTTRDIELRATTNKYDFVTMKTDGKGTPTSAEEPIFGIALEEGVSGDVITVVRAQPGLRVIMDNDNDSTTFAVTHVGGRFDITGDTEEQQVDTSTVEQLGTDADKGQLFCVEFNPQGFGFNDDDSIGMFEIAEIQGLGGNRD